MLEKTTIAAIATGMTESGIGIVRISGERAVAAADAVFESPKGKKLQDVKSHTAHYGNIIEGAHILDEVLVLVMRGPRSYTGEDTVEINCHGGSLVLRRVLEAVLGQGVRLAEPGEFTKRAFLNGRLDLTSAEAVIDVIHAKNDYALQSSLQLLKGILYEKIKGIREALIYEIAFIESALDDPEHISLEGYPQKLEKVVEEQYQSIYQLWKTSENGKIMKEGVRTVILGKPNAGKSTLLNTLLGEERAIVTDIAGTTRDTLEEQIRLSGITLNVVDTAGIRDTQDVVEQIGVGKAREAAKEADLVLYVMDASTPVDESDQEIIELISDRKAIILLNKSDEDMVVQAEDIRKLMDKPVIVISAKLQTGIQEIEKEVERMFYQGQISFNDEVVITNMRQKEALEAAMSSLKMVAESIEMAMPEDFYSIDLMHAYEVLGKIIGEAVEEDLVNEIFAKFCMGK